MENVNNVKCQLSWDYLYFSLFLFMHSAFHGGSNILKLEWVKSSRTGEADLWTRERRHAFVNWAETESSDEVSIGLRCAIWDFWIPNNPIHADWIAFMAIWKSVGFDVSKQTGNLFQWWWTQSGILLFSLKQSIRIWCKCYAAGNGPILVLKKNSLISTFSLCYKCWSWTTQHWEKKNKNQSPPFPLQI